MWSFIIHTLFSSNSNKNKCDLYGRWIETQGTGQRRSLSVFNKN